MDPELGKKTCDIELPQQLPKKKSKKVCVIVSCFIGLVLLSLVELLVLRCARSAPTTPRSILKRR